jgi:hypothetical protein
MRGLSLQMLMPAILILVAATGADDKATQSVNAARAVTASVTIIQAERVASIRDVAGLQKQDRQIRKREEKPMVEFY